MRVPVRGSELMAFPLAASRPGRPSSLSLAQRFGAFWLEIPIRVGGDGDERLGGGPEQHRDGFA
jgi:hypothetical protein